MKREFYLRSDQSNKFWTVEVDGCDVVSANGRIGAKPRETRHSYADPAAAQAQADKDVAAKLKKGYVEGALDALPAYAPPDWANLPMNEDTFWRVIALFNWKHTGDDDAVLAPATKALAQMPFASIAEFHRILSRKLYDLDTEAHAREIGEDAYTDDEGAYFSVDWFLYARCCVVANGPAFYDKVLKDPREFPKDVEFEALLYLPSNAVALQQGREPDQTEDFGDSVSYETFSNRADWGASALAD